MSEQMMLLRHGTAVELPAAAIIEAAKRDIERYIRFQHEGKKPDPVLGYLGPYEDEPRRYAFLPAHIKKARSVRELLLIAAQAEYVADKTTVRNRAILYMRSDRLVDIAETLP